MTTDKGLFEMVLGNPIIVMILLTLLIGVIGEIANAWNKARKDNLTKTSMTPLIKEVIDGEKDRVMQLLAAGDDVNAKTALGNTALIFAAKHGRVEIAKLLLEKGADVNPQGDEKKTALIFAIENGSKEIAKLLIEKGADPNIVDDSNFTPLVYAALNGYVQISERLINHGATPTDSSLLTAASNNKTEITRLLIEKGANINANANTQGMTALHRAIENKNIELVKYLIEHGADVNAKYYHDNFSDTPLFRAKHFVRDKAITKIIEDAGGKEK